jgi:NADP-dependent 3-hydroxy acid dehydrogenase YdfG
MTDTKTIFITGGSSGFGKAIIQEALRNNHQVATTFRSEEEVNAFNKNHGENALGVLMDVTHKDQIKAGVEKIIQRFGQIDVLINNAGMGIFALFESLNRKTFDTQFNVNVMGLIDVTNSILPHMRENKSGQIFNISSAIGIQSFAGGAIYGASKFTVEALTESLRQEVESFNIGVTMIEPGAFDTQFFNNSAMEELRKNAPEGYEPILDQIEENFQDMSSYPDQMGDPDKLAMVVVDLIKHDENPIRVPLGADCIDMIEDKIQSLQKTLEEWKEIGNHMSQGDSLKIKDAA